MSAGVRFVDDALHVVIYECRTCGREVGSPMPRRMVCLQCRVVMMPKSAKDGRASRCRGAPRNSLQPNLLEVLVRRLNWDLWRSSSGSSPSGGSRQLSCGGGSREHPQGMDGDGPRALLPHPHRSEARRRCQLTSGTP